jgi:alpha-tubulin suppressor-like RCC1 family protein
MSETWSHLMVLGTYLSPHLIPEHKAKSAEHELTVVDYEQFQRQPIIKVAAHGYHAIFVTEDGTPWGAGSNSHGQVSRYIYCCY